MHTMKILAMSLSCDFFAKKSKTDNAEGLIEHYRYDISP